MIRILIADDHPIFRNGLALAPSDAEGFEICGEATTADEAVAAAREMRPDLILLDLSMPGAAGRRSQTYCANGPRPAWPS